MEVVQTTGAVHVSSGDGIRMTENTEVTETLEKITACKIFTCCMCFFCQLLRLTLCSFLTIVYPSRNFCFHISDLVTTSLD